MSKFAIINSSNSTVTNVVGAGAGVIATTPASNVIALAANEWCSPGATYSPGSNPRFINNLSKSWTAYEFLNRFTDSELMDIRSRTATDSIMWKFLTFATAAQEIVNDDPVTVQGMAYLVTAGVITSQRKAEILGT